MALHLRRSALPLALAAGLLVPTLARAAFECPVKAPPATKPLPRDLNKDVKPYDDPRSNAALKADIKSMVQEGMPRGEVVDHAVDAYCSAVDAVPELSDAHKTGLVQRFASHVAQVVYAPEHSTVEDIILDVPVPPDLYSRIKVAAEQRKETQDDFVRGALQKAAGAP